MRVVRAVVRDAEVVDLRIVAARSCPPDGIAAMRSRSAERATCVITA
jgi:hypothetical protein